MRLTGRDDQLTGRVSRRLQRRQNAPGIVRRHVGIADQQQRPAQMTLLEHSTHAIQLACLHDNVIARPHAAQMIAPHQTLNLPGHPLRRLRGIHPQRKRGIMLLSLRQKRRQFGFQIPGQQRTFGWVARQPSG